MRILVCIKQVPDTTEIRIDPVKHTLIRDGVPSILNPYDGYALEAAARLKDKDPGVTITAVSMGPPQAEAVLREALSTAADRAYLVSGRSFGGSDTFATSYILANAIRRIEKTEGSFDAVFCGKQAIDGDTAQVGPELAEHLDYPQVTYGLTCETDEEGKGLRVVQEGYSGKRIIGVKFPCLVTFTKPDFDLRYPTVMRKLSARKAKITVLGDDDFPDMEKTRIGLKGSPTRVRKTFTPDHKKNGILLREETDEASAAKLADILSDLHVF